MNLNQWAIGSFSTGLGLIAGACLLQHHPIIGGAAATLIAMWDIILGTHHAGKRAYTGLLIAGVGTALFALYAGTNTFLVLTGTTLILLGWETGIGAVEIAAYPASAQRAFARARVPALLALMGAGMGLGTSILVVHVQLRFGTALALSSLALALLAALFATGIPGHSK